MTVDVVRQLVLQDNVYAIFDGLGTPTHLAVAPFLNSAEGAGRVRRLGLRVLEQPGQAARDVRLAARLRPRGQDPRPVHQGRTSRARRSASSTRTTSSARTGSRAWTYEIPAKQIVAKADLRPDQHHDRPAVAKLKAAGRPGRGLVLGAGLHRAAQAERARAELQPAARGQRRGLGPDHPGRAARRRSQAKADKKVNGNLLTQGIITDGYLPSLGEHQQQLDPAVHQDPRHSTSRSCPWTATWCTACPSPTRSSQAMFKAGPQPDPAGPDQRDQRRHVAGALGGPVRLLGQ